MGVGIAVRSRTNLCGYAACVCRNCAPRGTGEKRYVKRLTARSVRLSERREVMTELEMMRMESLRQTLMDMEEEDRYFDSMQLDDLYGDDDWC